MPDVSVPRPTVNAAVLNEQAARFEKPGFIASDPVAVPHGFDDPADQQVIAFFSALLAWGRRETTLDKMAELCVRMDYRPYRFVRTFDDRSRERLDGFKHRTFSSEDAANLCGALASALETFGSLETLFAHGLSDGDTDVGPAIEFASSYLLSQPSMPIRMRKHLARPSTGSACKRICLFLRWMVRPGPVDLGLWRAIQPSRLVLPLDVHSGAQARAIGMLERKQSDWKAAMELTRRCRALDPNDPCRFDYAFFGMGLATRRSVNRP